MANTNEENIIEELKIAVGLDTTKATKEHSEATNKIIAEVESMIAKYKTLGDTIDRLPTPGSMVRASEKKYKMGISNYGQSAFWDTEKGINTYAGKELTGTTEKDMQKEASRIRTELFRAQASAKREVELAGIPKVEEAFKTEKFDNIIASAKSKLTEFGKLANITPAQTNRAIVEAGLAAGKTAEQIKGMLVPMDSIWQKWGQIAGRALLTIPVWMLLRTIVQGLQGAFADGIKFMIEYESALAEIQIASNNSAEEVKNLGEAVLSLASTYGVLGTEALKAAKLFAQQGLSLSDTLAMTQSAIIGSQLLGQNVSEVAEGLTSATRAYNLEASDSIAIIDKWMKVQKEFAITSNDLMEGMKVAGATASAFGISIDTLNGQLTGIIETTRKTGSQAGNALVMMYTRLFSTAKDYIQTIAKVPVYLDENNRATMQNTNVYREAEDVMNDLAFSWNTLSEAEKINLAVQIGSRRNSTAFIALMDNYGRVLKAQIASMAAAGTAEEALNVLRNTSAYKTKQLTAAWQELVATVGDTGTWKWAIDMLNSLIRTLQNMTNAVASAKSVIRKEATTKLDTLNTEEQNRKALDDMLEMKKEIEEGKISKELLPDVETQLKRLKLTAPREFKIIEEEQYAARAKQIKPEASSEYKGILQQKQFTSGAGLLGLGTALTAAVAFLSNPVGWGGLILGGLGLASGAVGGARVGQGINTVASKDTSKEKLKAGMDELRGQDEVARLKAKKEADEAAKREQDKEDEIFNAEQQIQMITHTSNMLKIQGKTEQEILKYKIEQYKASNVIIGKSKEQLVLTKMENELQESIDEERQKIAEAKIFGNIDKTASLSQVQGKTEQQILQYKIAQYEAYNKIRYTTERQIEITKLQNDLEVQKYADIMAYSDELKTSLSDSINDVMSGKANVGDIFGNIQSTMIDSYRKTTSEGLSSILMGSTGVGDVFGGAMEKLKEAFGIVGNKLEDKIDVSNLALAQIVENTAALAGVSGSTPSSSIGGGGATGTAIGGISGGVLGLGIRKATDLWYGVGKTTATQGTYTAQQSSSGGLVGNTSAAADAIAEATKKSKSQNAAGIVGGGLESVMTGYNAYQSAKAGGASTAGAVMSGVGGLATTAGTILAVGATNGWNVVGWVLLVVGVLLTIASLFMKGKKSEQTSSESKSSEMKVSSKIDITNKQLEIVNRNLVALKNTITTYILPASAYFAEKYGLDEQFAVNSRRGLL